MSSTPRKAVKERTTAASADADATGRAVVGSAEAAAAYRLEDQVGFRLRKVNQRASEIFTGVMGEFDLTPMQFAMLCKLDDLGVVSQNMLGRHAAMDPATAFGVVGRLAKRGLVRQMPDADDARLRMIELTPAGRRLVQRMKAIGAGVSRRTLEPLTPAEAKLFLAMLARLE